VPPIKTWIAASDPASKKPEIISAKRLKRAGFLTNGSQRDVQNREEPALQEKKKAVAKQIATAFGESLSLRVRYAGDFTTAAKIAWVITEEFIHLIARNADRVIIVRIVANVALATALTRFPALARFIVLLQLNAVCCLCF
jgi:hypothetical protein